MSISAMKQALEALEGLWDDGFGGVPESMHKDAIAALRQAIAEAEKQEQWSCPHGIEDGACKQCYEDQTKPKMRRATRKEKIVNPGVYEVPVHAIDISQERVDETAKCGQKPAPNDYDRSIHNNPDAQAWAKFFMATVKEKEWCIDDIDEGLMLGWFANAMMAMHDHVKREWVGLTDEEVMLVMDDVLEGGGWLDVARAIEAKLKEKNA